MANASGQEPRHCLEDWLSLHGLTADECARLVSGERGRPRMSRLAYKTLASVRTELATHEACAFVLRAIAWRYPALAESVSCMLANGLVNIAPDTSKYPSPFTLHDGGNGFPYVSCIYQGGIGELLSLAHECGHAVQIIESKGIFVPPVLRETCAFLSENACEMLLEQELPGLHKATSELRAALDARYLGRHLKLLREALPHPGQAYDYVWNYPPARVLAARSADRLAPADALALFAGRTDLRQLIAMTETA